MAALVTRDREKAEAPTRDGEAASAGRFDVDFAQLKSEGYYDPDNLSNSLALELRAVKRRLLRRLGFLRATGDRQAFRRPGRQRNVVLVTSSQAGEGKTFCSVNLALSLALEDQIDTLLIDADVPRPKVRSRFGIAPGPGLTDVLNNPKLTAGSVVRRANQGPLKVLGEGSYVERASELFASTDCQQLITRLAAAHSNGLVIIDAPPTLATSDAVVLSRYVDEIVFVVEANRTAEPSVAAALDELLDVNPNVSLLLNRCLIGSGGADYASYDYYGRGCEKDRAEPEQKQGQT